MSELGVFLKRLRGKESLRDVMKRSGVSHNYLSIIEKGFDPRTKSPVRPSPDTLRSLAAAYNYPYEDLMKRAGYLDEASSFESYVKSGEGIAEQSANYNAARESDPLWIELQKMNAKQWEKMRKVIEIMKEE